MFEILPFVRDDLTLIIKEIRIPIEPKTADGIVIIANQWAKTIPVISSPSQEGLEQ